MLSLSILLSLYIALKSIVCSRPYLFTAVNESPLFALTVVEYSFWTNRMAPPSMAKSPIAVAPSWTNGKRLQPNIVWEKCFSTIELAIVAEDKIQVDKLLRPRRGNARMEYPHESLYEPPHRTKLQLKKDNASQDTSNAKRTGKINA